METILRERFRLNMTQDNPSEEIDGLKRCLEQRENDGFIICHSGQLANHETRREIVKNDITPPQKIR